MDREWEKFKGGPTEASQNRMYVTLNKAGVILMNRNAHRVLGKPAAVALYFNRERDMIGVEPANARLPLNFPVKESRTSWIIHAAPFCRHYGIKLTTTESFVRPDLDSNGILVLDLSNTITVSASTRKPRK